MSATRVTGGVPLVALNQPTSAADHTQSDTGGARSHSERAMNVARESAIGGGIGLGIGGLAGTVAWAIPQLAQDGGPGLGGRFRYVAGIPALGMGALLAVVGAKVALESED